MSVKGYVDHMWNGVTCLELCRFIHEDVIRPRKFWEGVHHVFSYKKVTKYQLLTMISNIFDLNLKITPQLGDKCYRNLSTKYDGFRIYKSIKTQLQELKEFNIHE